MKSGPALRPKHQARIRPERVSLLDEPTREGAFCDVAVTLAVTLLTIRVTLWAFRVTLPVTPRVVDASGLLG